MDSNYKSYDYISSFGRIDDILSLPAGNFDEADSLPSRDKLTFTNGFYANCSALFVDLRDSSRLPEQTTRPVLAKIYRAYISELVAIFNSSTLAREINIVGDCVWGVFNTPYKPDIDEVFALAAKSNSLIKVLNYKLAKKDYPSPLSVGIGMSWGRALMIKAGYSGSGINDVVYMGDVVNQAAKLAARGGRGYPGHPLQVDVVFYANMNDDNQKLVSRSFDLRCYEGTVVNTLMQEWYDANCT